MGGLIDELKGNKEGNVKDFFQLFDVLIAFINQLREIITKLLAKLTVAAE
ncbi:MAG: hypothetical protein K6C36_06070 [Clostridia bacterium]|nr:hypothetical protein [Clostridia bacterium]